MLLPIPRAAHWAGPVHLLFVKVSTDYHDRLPSVHGLWRGGVLLLVTSYKHCHDAADKNLLYAILPGMPPEQYPRRSCFRGGYDRLMRRYSADSADKASPMPIQIPGRWLRS